MTVPELDDALIFRNGARAKNRVVLAPMTNKQSHEDGSLADDELQWLRARSKGGFGVVMSCATHVAKDGQGWPNELGIFDDTLVPGWRRLADALREDGALSIAQIFHGGFRADAAASGIRPWSASENDGSREATEEDLQRVIVQFADAAARAHTAGLDGVELHGAHGYLLTQFLSTVNNRRTDAWGGSLENRARLIREVTRAVRARVPSSFLVGMRLSPEDFGNAKGLDLDESLAVAGWLVADGVDFVDLSLWNALRNTTKRPDEHAITAFRKVVPEDVLLFVAGSLWTKEDADRMLALGADGVALGRCAIANPDWPQRIEDPAWEPKRPPLTRRELLDRGLSSAFVSYVSAWKGFVTPE